MRFIILHTAFLFLFVAHGQQLDFDAYKKLNDAETRLMEFADSDSVLKIKLQQLEIINHSRIKHKVSVLRLDILACRVANKQAKESAENRYLSHWNLAGQLPFERYAEAGGTDHVVENAFSSWGNDFEEKPSLAIALEEMQKGHGDFMAERYPNDGHKKTVIEPEHNFVGFGYYISGDYFSYYEEYIDRYLLDTKLESKGMGYMVSFTIPEGYELYYFAIEYLKPTKKKNAQQLDKTGSYMDGGQSDFITKWPRSAEIKTYNLDFEPTKKGTYYIKIRIKKSNPKKSKEKEPFGASGWVVYKN